MGHVAVNKEIFLLGEKTRCDLSLLFLVIIVTYLLILTAHALRPMDIFGMLYSMRGAGLVRGAGCGVEGAVQSPTDQYLTIVRRNNASR